LPTLSPLQHLVVTADLVCALGWTLITSGRIRTLVNVFGKHGRSYGGLESCLSCPVCAVVPSYGLKKLGTEPVNRTEGLRCSWCQLVKRQEP